MRVAIPLYGTRISPRFFYSDRMLIANVADGALSSKKIVRTNGTVENDWLKHLSELGVDVFVCGGADSEFLKEANTRGVKVISNVAGDVDEVVSEFLAGRLRSGHGLFRTVETGEAGTGDNKEPDSSGVLEKTDCIACLDRACLDGRDCVPDIGESWQPQDEAVLKKIMEVAEDVYLEPERKLCRVAEVVYFALGMEYKRIGVAFCVEMFREAESLGNLLRRFFEISPVCCRVGGHTDGTDFTADNSNEMACNPFTQAAILNRSKTDMNIVVGLCVGCDLIFAEYSEAPVTTLFVKDKSLANNPVGALYSKYYFDNLVEEMSYKQ
ncbi:DUF1847 domain-containing protein [bacterium]